MQAGQDALHLAWDVVDALYQHLEWPTDEESDEIVDVTDAFWDAARAQLGNALGLIHQGLELALRGRIAAISPFLLLSGTPNGWPAGAATQDTPFSRFRTVDARELPKLHDVVAPEPLDRDLVRLFGDVRDRRNRIMHLGPLREQLSPSDVLGEILQALRLGFPEVALTASRRNYLLRTTVFLAFGAEYLQEALATDLNRAIRVLSPSQLNSFFGMPEGAVLAYCPQCSHFCEEPRRIAYFTRDQKDQAVCVGCEDSFALLQQVCKNCGESGVLADEWETCLICGV